MVVGRDLRADVRVAHPLISRAHVLLRFDQDRWVAIDNGSLNGLFVNGRRVPAVDIRDGLAVNVGNPDGPLLHFDVGRHTGAVGRPPQTTAIPVTTVIPAPGTWPPIAPPPPRPQPVAPPPASGNLPTQMGPTAIPARGASGDGNLATSMLKILRPGKSGDLPQGAVKIGRATDNDIVVPDVLASRHHATLIPSAGGAEILDNRSINGTFVNGQRVEAAALQDGDVVTIGNIDLIFSGGTLLRRSQTEAATRTGGLEVRGLTWTIEGTKTLLDNISMDARPGTLTAVIGPSGAGKSTFARQVAGYTHPTSGTVTFEGHDIHAEYASLRSRI